MSDTPTYVTYDSQADVLYVRFEKAPDNARVSRDLGGDRMVEFGPDGEACGVEFIGASAGVDPTGLPREPEIREALRRVVDVANLRARV